MKRVIGIVMSGALLTGGAVVFGLTPDVGAQTPHPLDCGSATLLVEVTGSESQLSSVVISDEDVPSDGDEETATVTAASGWGITAVQLKSGTGATHDSAVTYSPPVSVAVVATATGQDVSHVDVCVVAAQQPPTTTTTTTATTTTVPPTTTTTAAQTTDTTVAPTTTTTEAEVAGVVVEPDPDPEPAPEEPEPAPEPEPEVEAAGEPAPADPAEAERAQPRFTG